MLRRYTYLAFLALVIVFCMLVVAATLPVWQACAANGCGTLSARYESGTDPGEIDPNCAYGAYQMSTGNAYLFAEYLASKSTARYANWGEALVAAYKKDGSSCGAYFDAVWHKEAAKELSTSEKKKVKVIAKKLSAKVVKAGNASKFLHQQYLYVMKAYYKPAVAYWKEVASDFKMSYYTRAFKNVLFSTAVQHGPYGSAYYIFKNVIETLGGYSKSVSEKKLINAIYYERARLAKKKTSKITGTFYRMSGSESAATYYGLSSTLAGKYLVHFYSSPANVQVGVYVRLAINERKSALAMLSDCSTFTVSEATYRITSIPYAKVLYKQAPNKKTVCVSAFVSYGDVKYKVTKVGKGAFKSSKIRVVKIGKNVSKIVSKAFNKSAVSKLIIKTKLLASTSSVTDCFLGDTAPTITIKWGAVGKKYVKESFSAANTSAQKIVLKK